MLYMVTFTINIPPMLAYIPYMDPMGNISNTVGCHVPYMPMKSLLCKGQYVMGLAFLETTWNMEGKKNIKVKVSQFNGLTLKHL